MTGPTAESSTTHMLLPANGLSVHGSYLRVDLVTHASLWASGMLLVTSLTSPGPKPVAVRACLGLLKLGPTGPLSSVIGRAGMESFLSRVCVAILSQLTAVRWEREAGDG